MAFKARLDSKAAQLAQDDSSLPSNGGNPLANKNPTNFKSLINHKKNMNGKAGGQHPPPVAKLPRTGIEQPFLSDRPRFKDLCKDFEPIHQFNTSMCDEFARLEQEKLLNCQSQSEKIVFDCIDFPTQKREGDNTPYLDENDAIELPPEDNPVDNRKYYPYGPSG